MVVHFHGFDASVCSILESNRAAYQRLFEGARAVVVPSQAMAARLEGIGAPREKIHRIPYGVDPVKFRPGDPSRDPPTFVAVGRFVEKKGPHVTLLAFASLERVHPGATLTMIGEGPLLDSCRDLAQALKIDHAVTFLGAQPNSVVAGELTHARAFVQHSLQARSGDCEGTPVAVVEAGASAVPVVATRHEGIPDVVIDGETGFLVEERDVGAMADRMIRLAGDSELARKLGLAARKRIETHFTLDQSIARLRSVLEASVI
jgi:glycosyltransferase involved in cell wall biosynthesis